MLVDSHCHLDGALFAPDRDVVLARASACGVGHIVLPAVGEDSWQPILELARRAGAPRLHAALGVHPVSLSESPAANDDELLTALARLVAEARTELVAIGECGLDAVTDLSRADFARQERVLVAQLTLARRTNLPVILHARGSLAYRRLAELLAAQPLGPAGGVIHSYSGGVDLVRPFVALGLHFGFAGPATYPDARKVRASVDAVPLDRLLLETDAPDQTPVPHRPGRCEPAYVADVLAGLAAIRRLSVDELAAITTANATRLFGLR